MDYRYVNGLNMKWSRAGLITIGAASLLIAVGTAWLIMGIASVRSERFNRAKAKDVLFILNWGGISTNQSFKVVASYESPRSLTGDHLDYYCIELSRFDVAEPAKSEWHDGPEKDPVLAEALEFGVNDARQHGDCIPSALEANSEAMKVMFRSVVKYGRQPTAADIMLYDPKTKRLYYVTYKT